MKLRNRKDNFIADLEGNWYITETGNKIVIKNYKSSSRFEYTSLEQMAKEWETVKEPLLKGELKESLKIWAKLNNFTKLEFKSYSNIWSTFLGKNSDDYYITYELSYELPYLEEKEYDIKELVG